MRGVFHPCYSVIGRRRGDAGQREVIVGRQVVVPVSNRVAAQAELVCGPLRIVDLFSLDPLPLSAPSTFSLP